MVYSMRRKEVLFASKELASASLFDVEMMMMMLGRRRRRRRRKKIGFDVQRSESKVPGQRYTSRAVPAYLTWPFLYSEDGRPKGNLETSRSR